VADKPTPTRGFVGRQSNREIADRMPPGQYLAVDFPVLSFGPTPAVKTKDWTFS
jgi:hypothetical protein